MPLLDSFTVDHTRMHAPAVRVAKNMRTPKGDDITVFDLRFCVPNQEILPEKGIHTLEHLFAGFMREHLNGANVEIIDISKRRRRSRRLASRYAGYFKRARPKPNPRAERIPMRHLPHALP